MDESKLFGQWLRERRTAMDLTRAELARQMGYSSETLKKVEEGNRRPSKELVAQLANALNLTGPDLERFIRFARGVVDGAPAPLPTGNLEPGTGNLPAPLTDLIGRATEVKAVTDLLIRREIRLLTLTGPPGVGKSRLAIQVGQEMQPLFPDGVWFISLATIVDPKLVAQTVAHVLGVLEGKQMRQRLTARLRGRNALLILDNFEQVLPAAAFVADLLEHSPALKALLTSQEPSRLYGEQRYGVQPLNPEMAMALFARRAQAVRPEFEVTEALQDPVRILCAHLDHLPLAIELAAARCEHFTPQEMLDHLNSSQQAAASLLVSPASNLTQRHRQMWNAIDWGYRLLSPQEQRLLRRLSVFAGGWSLDGAQAVFGNDPAEDGYSVPLHLLALGDKSLIQAVSGPFPRRYDMLATIRDFAAAALRAEEDVQPVRDRHGRYFLELTHHAAQQMVGPQRLAWLQRLDEELDNLRAALGWWLSTDGLAAAHMATSLREFWFVRGYFDEALVWLTQVAAAVPDNSAERAAVLLAMAQLSDHKGDLGRAQSLAEEAQQIAQRRQAPALMAEALRSLGWIAYNQHQPDLARSRFAEALTLFRSQGDQPRIADLLSALVCVTPVSGDPVERSLRRLLEESMAINRELGHEAGLIFSLQQLGRLEMLAGRYAEAAAIHDEALGLIRKLAHKPDLAWQVELMGEIAWLRGDVAQAQHYWQEGSELFQQMGAAEGLAISLHHLGQAARKEGRLVEAAQLYGESLAMHTQAQNRHMIARCLAGLGGVALAQEQVATGGSLLAAAQEILDQLPPFLAPADQAEYAALTLEFRRRVDGANADEIWEKGAVLQLEEAVKLGHSLVRQLD